MVSEVRHSSLATVSTSQKAQQIVIPYLKYMSISSVLILEVIATIGIAGAISRMQTVAETPSRLGMIISIRMRSNAFGPALFILFTASRPSRYELSASKTISQSDALQQFQLRIQRSQGICIL